MGERFVGKETFRQMRQHAPSLSFTTWRITGSGDHWCAENFMTVEGGEPQMTVNALTFRGDKVAHEIVYITQPFDAAPERAAPLGPEGDRLGPLEHRVVVIDRVRRLEVRGIPGTTGQLTPIRA